MSSEVNLKMFDLLGREVATLVNGRQAAGKRQVRFDASGLSSGMYINRIETPESSKTHKILLIK